MQFHPLPFQCRTHILLTGACFTHNFGVPLASQMWANLLSHPAVQSSNEIRELLLEDPDFESVYEKVISSGTEESRKAIRTAIKDIFLDVDSTIREYGTGLGKPPVLTQDVEELISNFAGKENKKGFFFTINQDLFVERMYHNDHKYIPVTLPGIPANAYRLRTNPRSVLSGDDYCNISQELIIDNAQQAVKNKNHQYLYLKLHGSQNWISERLSGGLVIGKGKSEQIAEEPLLSYYINLFEQVLNLPNRKLLTIGYGFKDPHINNIIQSAAKNHGLKLYIISPEPPKDFKDKMCNSNHTKEIWKSIRGYYNCTLADFFPGGGSPFGPTTKYRNFQKEFFDQ